MSTASRTCPMSVENTGFLLDRLGKDCHPLQFLRELTQNSIEAIKRTGVPGTVTWEMDQFVFDKSGSKLSKLSVVDTGDGMTGPELMTFINKLSSSSSRQSMDGNYGVGAKITAAVNNPEGVLYSSWKDSKGSLIKLWKDPDTEIYGLDQFNLGGGVFGHVQTLLDTAKPASINTNGTKVTLLGKSYGDNTCKPPVADLQAYWVTKYLSERYFKIPESVTLQVQEDHKRYRSVKGMGSYLDSNAEKNGKVRLSNAIVHWWILKPTEERTHAGRHIETGHIAALYQNEIYEMRTSRSRNAVMQEFGIVFEISKVVLYIEPVCEITTNTARTLLLIKNEPLPWSDWAHEFREHLPEELILLQEESINKSKGQNQSDILRRLQLIQDIMAVSGYKKSPNGEYRASGSSLSNSGEQEDDENGDSNAVDIEENDDDNDDDSDGNSTPNNNRKKRRKKIEDLFDIDPTGQPAEVRKDLNYPIVRWLTTTNGTRTIGLLEDRAAGYSQATNELLINMDFRGFTDAVKHCLNVRKDTPTKIAEPVVVDAIKTWYEQALAEPIISLRSMKGSKHWTETELSQALSEEALTLVALQRYHTIIAANRQIGATLGSSQKG